MGYIRFDESMQQKSFFLISTIVLLVALGSLSGASFILLREQPQPNVVVSELQMEPNVITVSGTGAASLKPDRVIIDLSIIEESHTAKEASQRAAGIFEMLMTRFLEEGIQRDQVETRWFRINAVYDYSKEGSPTLVGYRANHGLTVTIISDDPDSLGMEGGEIIDVAINAGVTQVQGITFTVSDEAAEALRDDALKSAVSNARNKAQLMAETLGITIINVRTISESGLIPPPIPVYRDLAFAQEGAFSSEVVPGTFDVSVTVQASFIIGQ